MYKDEKIFFVYSSVFIVHSIGLLRWENDYFFLKILHM